VQKRGASLVLHWHVGRRIRKDILKDKRAEYGQEIVQTVSAQLAGDYGRGLSPLKTDRPGPSPSIPILHHPIIPVFPSSRLPSPQPARVFRTGLLAAFQGTIRPVSAEAVTMSVVLHFSTGVYREIVLARSSSGIF